MKRILFLLITALLINNLIAQQSTLQYFIDKALTNSPLLKDYGNQIRSNSIDSMRIHAGFGPQINAVSNNYYAPIAKGWGYDEIVTDIANISAQISVTKEIVSRQNRENQYEAVKIGNQSLMNTRKISEQDLILNVTDQYINTYGSWKELSYNSEVMALLKKEEMILKQLTQNDVYSQTDYLTFLVTLQQQEFQFALINSQYRNNLTILNYLCGIEDTTTISLTEPAISVATLPAVQNSVFYQSFINDSLRLTIEDRQIDFSYKPKISVFTDAGYFSSWYYQPWKNFGISAGINLSIPIYDGQQRKMQHDKIIISEQTRQNYQSFYLKQYHQQINQLLQQLKANQQLGTLLTKQTSYNQTLIDANHKLLETGNLQVADYIIAINNYLSVRNALVQNIIDKYHLINQINYWNRTK